MHSRDRKEQNSPEARALRQRIHSHFHYLYDSAINHGLKSSDFEKIRAVVELREDTDNFEIPDYVFKYFGAWLFLFISLIIVYLSEWPVENDTLFKFWMDAKGVDSKSHRCAVEILDFVQEMSRPPVKSCDFCRNVKSVKRVENISPEQFEKLYAYSGRPVVVKDGTKNWTASQHFSYQFLKTVYSKNSTALRNVEEHCQFFPYKSKFKNLEEVFEMSDDRAYMKDKSSPWYIGWSNCDLSAANTLRQHYSRPYFLPQQSESSKTDWIFMGSPGYGASLHIDYVNHPSWQAQITGTKRWTLEPPPECYFQCPRSFTVTVQPGEIIVLDTNMWYHSTLNVGENISITIGSEFD